MTQTLVLYDILSNLPGNNWSPNPAKPRYILNYKGLPFVTVWVEYSDISIAMKAIGAKPNKRSDGTDVYTVPVLSDPNTGALISDSLEIASYLEKTYPEKAIFPDNSESLIREFDSAHFRFIVPGVKPIFARSTEIMSPASAKFFIKVRSIDVPLPWDATYSEDWALLERGYNTAYEWYQKTDGKWFMGDTFSYADIIVASCLLWFKRVLKEDEWVRISSWNGGKWGQLYHIHFGDISNNDKFLPQVNPGQHHSHKVCTLSLGRVDPLSQDLARKVAGNSTHQQNPQKSTYCECRKSYITFQF